MISALFGNMEPNAQFHSPTLLSQQNNRESVTLLSDQRRMHCISVCVCVCVCTYVCMYVYT
jgi:hypothetical protein